MHHLSTTRRRIVVTVAAAGGLLASAVVAPTIVTAAPVQTADAQPGKIAAALTTQLSTGPGAFWVRFAARADLADASRLSSWKARGEAVYQSLTTTAETSQADVRAFLDERGVDYEAFHITNAIHITSGDSALAAELSSFTGVSELIAPVEYSLQEPVERVVGTEATDAIEWGVTNINADDVWNTFDDRGEKIVIANIDTGVDWDHPALKPQYRGTKADGSVNHNYNWFNSSGSAAAPFDNNGHGTHTMGTMVGDDGGSNQIGVAPGAKWITANGCNTCTDVDLIESGEWMLAPTKLNGNRPKTGKRPHIINNSWGTTVPGFDPFYDDVISSWDASGIFGQWSNGNSGPSCSTSGSPGSLTETYSAGAYDINNTIASFSARGPGESGNIKPNIAAPGVNVRSAYLNNSYANLSGTSMASPHVAGAIALLWSEVSSYKRDIDATRTALDNSATDVSALTCGGTLDDNNVFGEGRLNAFKLVDDAVVVAAPTGAVRAVSTVKTIG